jgi:hypothetical protein
LVLPAPPGGGGGGGGAPPPPAKLMDAKFKSKTRLKHKTFFFYFELFWPRLASNV